MQERGRDGRTILLAVASVACAVLAIALAISLAAYAVLGEPGNHLGREAPSPLQVLVLAGAVLMTGALFVPAAFYSFRFLAGSDIPPSEPGDLGFRQALVLFLLWIGSSLWAQLLIREGFWRWFTPILYLIAIGVPVYFSVRVAARGLKPGSRRRFWGIFATGLAAGTSLAFAVEAILAICVLFGAVLYLALQPGQLAGLQLYLEKLANISKIDEAVNALGPWLTHPLVLALGLAFFSGATPAIEELAKSVAVWTVYDHLKSPAQGFVAGALSGAGFGLLESLLASAAPDSGWAAALLIRGGSSIMHILAAAVIGWGIAEYRRTNRTRTLLGAYALGIFLHSTWNAAVVAAAYGGLRMALSGAGPDLSGTVLIVLGATVLLVLFFADPIALAVINTRLRLTMSESARGTDRPATLTVVLEAQGSSRDPEG